MAKVLITSTAPGDNSYRPHEHNQMNTLISAAQYDRFGVHSLEENASKADIILFVENCSTIQHYLEILKNRYYKLYKEKCYLYSKYDLPIPFLPGIYPSVEKKWYSAHWVRSWSYLKAFSSDMQVGDYGNGRVFLYSFVGSSLTHPLRRKIFSLDNNRHYVYDSSHMYPYSEMSKQKKIQFKEHYVDMCANSKFILCPRGRGASSIRLFESMRMGRAPVIISDSWVPPEGPDWDEFSVRIPESQLMNVAAILEEYESLSEEMGLLAREAWEKWFSREVAFHRIVENCIEISRERRYPAALLRCSAFVQLARPVHFKQAVRVLLREIKALSLH